MTPIVFYVKPHFIEGECIITKKELEEIIEKSYNAGYADGEKVNKAEPQYVPYIPLTPTIPQPPYYTTSTTITIDGKEWLTSGYISINDKENPCRDD